MILLGSLIPAWFCVPVAALLFAAVVLNMRSTARSDHPPSRKRIRLANGLLMLINLPLLAAGFSLINPSAHPTLWALVWIAAMALLTCNVALAVFDVVNTMRLARRMTPRLPSLHDVLSKDKHSGSDRKDTRTDVL